MFFKNINIFLKKHNPTFGLYCCYTISFLKSSGFHLQLYIPLPREPPPPHLDNITAYYFSYFHPSLCPKQPVTQAVMCDLDLSLRLPVRSEGGEGGGPAACLPRRDWRCHAEWARLTRLARPRTSPQVPPPPRPGVMWLTNISPIFWGGGGRRVSGRGFACTPTNQLLSQGADSCRRRHRPPLFLLLLSSS